MAASKLTFNWLFYLRGYYASTTCLFFLIFLIKLN
nr:MAG TPA: hypothetical protein [Caudoviricetes sp.]